MYRSFCIGLLLIIGSLVAFAENGCSLLNRGSSVEASKSAAPTSSVNVAEALSRAAVLPLSTTCPNWAAVRIANVVVVLTLSTREVPSTAYITMGTSAV